MTRGLGVGKLEGVIGSSGGMIDARGTLGGSVWNTLGLDGERYFWKLTKKNIVYLQNW